MQELRHQEQQQQQQEQQQQQDGEEPSKNGDSNSVNRPSPSNSNNKSNLQHAPTTRKEKVQKSLGYYIAIETVWHVSLFAACYRYRPLLRLSRTSAGKQALERLQQWNQNRTRGTSSTHHRITSWWQRLQNKETYRHIPGGQRSLVAASEWFFFNKTIGIPLWPTKMLLAGWMAQQVEQRWSNAGQ